MKHGQTKAANGTDWGAMMVLAMSMLLSSMGTSVANIALPALTRDFAAPFHHVQWVVTAYLAAMTVFAVIAGWIGDAVGLRRVHLAGLGLFLLTSLFCGLAPDLSTLVIARGVQGLAAAILMSLTMALMRDAASETRLGQAMGMLGTMSALGTALGPSLGGVLVEVAGWRGAFLGLVPLAAPTLILSVFLLPHDTGRALPTLRIAGPADRLLPQVLRLLPALSANLLVATVMMATLVIGPFYLGHGLGLSESASGVVMAIGPVISIFCGLLAGRAVDAWGPPRILLAGLSLLAVGVFLLAVLPGRLGLGGYVLAIVILTPSYQLFLAANNTAVMAGVAKDRRGTVSGLLGLSRNLGLMLGASVMGAVFAFGVGAANFAQVAAPAIHSGMRLTFLLAVALILLALGTVALSWWWGRGVAKA